MAGHSFTKSFKNLKKTVPLEPGILKVTGFLATVDKPSKLKITGTEERATLDLFVNGRLREKNVIRHMPTQRIVENYLYGQIHFDALDRPDADPFTSSREGIIEDDAQFALLKKDLKELLQKVIDQWDELRLERGEDGDDENPRKSKKERKALDMYNIAKSDYQAAGGAKATKDKVDTWLNQLQNDAAYNLQSYVDCFLSENLVRKYIEDKGLKLSTGVSSDATKWKKREDDTKGEANISFEIRAAPSTLSYLDMDALAVTAEGSKTTNGKQSLWSDAVQYKPARNAVGHTGLLSPVAKTHLNTTHENIKARLRALLSKP
ncbi:hypothetical protein GR197_30740 [Rhizobium phaseoli]|uniref:Uncharacterized protein n=1 Tax=Rhizobium phaseoli TaxID=396 RepID=A0A7K3UME2_9HYPH|nr:hypothetical protein [Rhizobium phaseoli]